MRTETQVRLDRREEQVIVTKAIPSARVGAPDTDDWREASRLS